jgi:putative flippase GtrA
VSSLFQRLLRAARGDLGRKFLRYSAVSVVAVIITAVTVFLVAWLFHASGVVANTIGTVVATPPSYILNRRWAWGKSGKSHLWKEVVPFWALTFVGWAGSTACVAWADHVATGHHLTPFAKGIVYDGASLFAYGVIWVIKFVILNRLMFVHHGPVAHPGPSHPRPVAVERPAPAMGGAAELRG